INHARAREARGMVTSVVAPRTAQFRQSLATQQKTMRALGALFLACSFAGCGSSSPTAATPPINLVKTWNLTGTVSSSAGGGLSSATVSVVDGPDAGKQATA